ncbi:AAA family ATPase [Nonomuraea jabiensis]|uniref:SpoVK/Ycf46/Vps4 family AAA+-type ATPase n=1 Tax=Nonomuraea jabiensis TaxID=882448 RepID=A0A7W9G0U6_9ACTN|nr:ATP-binding protein [Nonomuraea jabiensis]MBB5775029.1 SpoVK/Ycf46/Vps4 family AAA+-type ATPase [Nonomuraea jabiensis]
MTASADHVKALVRAHAEGDEDAFYSVALQLAAKSARQGHNRLAAELRDLVDEARAQPIRRYEPTPVVQPRGELADLVAASFPDIRLADMTLARHVREQLRRVLHEQRQRERLENHGFAPIYRLLLVGPPGTGKSMSAAMLAQELSLPLFTVRLDGLISRFMGQTAAKLRLVFDAAAKSRAVYLFDEFDAIGAERRVEGDVGEARRILNSFLLFLDEARPESLVVAATNHAGILDNALFRRFDAVITYDVPSAEQAIEVLRRRLGSMNINEVDWDGLANQVGGLSHAELVRAAEAAAKDAILAGGNQLSSAALRAALDARRATRNG